MNKIYSICLFLSLLFFSIASTVNADPLVEAMQKHYASMDSFKADFIQVLRHQASGSDEKRSGTAIFEKPMRLRWETNEPFPELLVVTEREVWNYLPDEELAYRYPPEIVQDSRSIVQVITGQSRLDQDFLVERLADDKGLAVLQLFPKEPTMQLVEATLWLEPATKVIQQVQIIDFYGNTNNITFTKFLPNAPVFTDAFSFIVPQGVDVEDVQEQNGPVPGLLQ